jgi:hypothetical protein
MTNANDLGGQPRIKQTNSDMDAYAGNEPSGSIYVMRQASTATCQNNKDTLFNIVSFANNQGLYAASGA